MTQAHSLRIESGARAGDVVPLSHSPFLIGRQSSCDLQLSEPSVSGRHAELRQQGDTWVLHDLGSTNGTRIGRLKVGEAELEVGLTFSLGDVGLTLVVAAAAPSAPSQPASKAAEELSLEPVSLEEGNDEIELELASSDQPQRGTGSFADQASQTKFQPIAEEGLGDGEALDAAMSVRADHLAEAGRRSPWPLAALAGAFLAAGGAYYWWAQSAPSTTDNVRVAPVPGDVLSGAGQFEQDADWQAREDWSSTFRTARSARKTGTQGLLAELAAGERAQHVSPAVTSPELAGWELRGQVRAEGSITVRLGLRFARSQDEELSEATLAYGPVIRGTDEWQEWSLQVTAPEGYDRVAVVASAWADGERVEPGEDEAAAPIAGSVWLDDLILTQAGRGEPTVNVQEVHVQALGDPATALTVHKIDRLLLAGVQVHRGSAAELETLSVSATEYGAQLATPASGAVQWHLIACAALVEGGVSTMGAEGYLPRRSEFDAEGVTDIVLGTGHDLVRLALPAPARVSGRPLQGSFRLTIFSQGGPGPLIKTRFGDEFKAALELADTARKATRDGQYGLALASWKAMLDRYPYEAEDVAKADAARSELLRAGFEAIQGVEAEWERARFFQLQKGFADCLQRAQDLRAQYEGSELEAPLQELVQQIQADMAGFASAGEQEAGHLEALLQVLNDRGATRLVERLQNQESQE